MQPLICHFREKGSTNQMKTIHKSEHYTKIIDVFWHKKAQLFMSLAFPHNTQTAWSEELLF